MTKKGMRLAAVSTKHIFSFIKGHVDVTTTKSHYLVPKNQKNLYLYIYSFLTIYSNMEEKVVLTQKARKRMTFSVCFVTNVTKVN